MHETFICSICGAEHPADQRTEFAGQFLCCHCQGEHTILCRVCGTHILHTENAGTRAHPLCQRCFDAEYTTCSHCGTLLRQSEAFYQDSDEDEEYPYCDVCYYASPKGIHDYSYHKFGP